MRTPGIRGPGPPAAKSKRAAKLTKRERREREPVPNVFALATGQRFGDSVIGKPKGPAHTPPPTNAKPEVEDSVEWKRFQAGDDSALAHVLAEKLKNG